MVFAYYSPNDFFKLLNRASSVNSTGVAEFTHALMFFEGVEHMHLYKRVSGIIYATKVILDADRNVSSNFGTGQEEQESEVLIGVSADSFRLKLMKEFSAQELLAPLDIQLLLQQHIHDQHTHAGTGVDDIKT